MSRQYTVNVNQEKMVISKKRDPAKIVNMKTVSSMDRRWITKKDTELNECVNLSAKSVQYTQQSSMSDFNHADRNSF